MWGIGLGLFSMQERYGKLYLKMFYYRFATKMHVDRMKEVSEESVTVPF